MRMTTLIACTVYLGCLVAGPAGCQARAVDPPLAMDTGWVNHTCPISGIAVTEHDVVDVHDGRPVAFACRGCYNFWRTLSDADKDRVLRPAVLRTTHVPVDSDEGSRAAGMPRLKSDHVQPPPDVCHQ